MLFRLRGAIVCRDSLSLELPHTLFQTKWVPLGRVAKFSFPMDCLTCWINSLNHCSAVDMAVASGLLRLPRFYFGISDWRLWEILFQVVITSPAWTRVFILWTETGQRKVEPKLSPYPRNLASSTWSWRKWEMLLTFTSQCKKVSFDWKLRGGKASSSWFHLPKVKLLSSWATMAEKEEVDCSSKPQLLTYLSAF